MCRVCPAYPLGVTAGELDPVAADLHRSFLDAFPVYLESRLSALGVDADAYRDVIEAAAQQLDGDLFDLLALPAAQQRESPLEIFRAATAALTEALLAAGVEPIERDIGEAEARPDDVFGIAPPSSQVLGDAAWRAHLDWGISKAAAVAGVVPATAASGEAPTAQASSARVAVLSSDLMDRSKIEAAVREAGFELAVWRNPAAVVDGIAAGGVILALVDLTHPAAFESLEQLSEIPVIAYGPHADVAALEKARNLGASALPRSRFFDDPVQLVRDNVDLS